ncbi:terminase large subunit domain-containing protein [Aeromicrobium sp. Leaf291]|uniref:terminase large subunit domain-containing protein n=1 Tax=Aeromicrobium sp. Leaf291 TaxID=1736325 RepID=UPI000700C06B|nr:terminase family protein [Aeromicrobium sp. Leaf291]KQP81607.1 hypothetical protein ASF35_16380 [Aeromicrobium sp. Leaf291]
MPTTATRPRKAAVGGHPRTKALQSLPVPGLLSPEQLDAEIAAHLAAAAQSARRWACSRPGCNGRPHAGWRHRHARASQRLPAGDWSTWLIMSGRGWGKTRTGSESLKEWIEQATAEGRQLHIAVVARKETLAREICFEHRKSGLITILGDLVEKYDKTVGNLQLHLKGGHVIRGFGAQEPDNLRGWEFDAAWCDEYAAWPAGKAQEVMDMLWFCLREAKHPRVLISTTPKALPHIKVLVRDHEAEVKAGVEEPSVRLTTGHTNENAANLSGIALRRLDRSYAGTRMGKQELDGELLEDVEGALWKGWMLADEDFRPHRSELPDLERVVVAVDPAVTSTETADENGFAVCARSFPFDATHRDTRPLGYVLHSEAARLTPTQTMKRAAELYHEHQADAVVLEANNGGEYLATVLMQVDPTVNYRIVHASRDKRARAAPVAGLYEQRRIRHVGPAKVFDALETVMTSYVGAKESQEKSPDILDALVWALWDLFLDPEQVAGAVEATDGRLAGRR